MNRQEILYAIADSVRKKHPWRISQDKYLSLFGELPREFLEERIHLDNLIERAKGFRLCLIPLDSIKVDIKLSLDELIRWELSLDKWEEVKAHNIVLNDIKKILKSK